MVKILTLLQIFLFPTLSSCYSLARIEKITISDCKFLPASENNEGVKVKNVGVS
jgi:hypothetical protein